MVTMEEFEAYANIDDGEKQSRFTKVKDALQKAVPRSSNGDIDTDKCAILIKELVELLGTHSSLHDTLGQLQSGEIGQFLASTVVNLQNAGKKSPMLSILVKGFLSSDKGQELLSILMRL